MIFSFGLLGFVGLQARAVQFSVSAEDTNRAALLANDIGAALAYTQVDQKLPDSMITAWQTKVADPTLGGLPNGTGTVEVDGNIVTITLTWKATGAASGANATNKYVTQVVRT